MVSLFQFTPLREGRLAHSAKIAMYCRISIHAPPRGATGGSRSITDRCNYFNSRPSARGDGACKLPDWERTHFNSRPSARGDLLRGKYAQGVHNFNSRPSARGDYIDWLVEFCVINISIHAPPRGATICQKDAVGCENHFNSRPSARGDKGDAEKGDQQEYFNSRPSARGDALFSVLCTR